MAIAVKRGDVIYFSANGISAITVRASLSFRPDSWWSRVFRGLSAAAFGGTDPHNLQADVTSTTDRSYATTVVQITEDGEIDSAIALLIGGSMPAGPGEVFLQCALGRSGTLGMLFMTVFSGYIHGTSNPTYPAIGLPAGPFDGPGRIRAITTADPAANAEIAAQVVPANAKWRLLTFTVQLVQGITQTPLPTLRIRSLGATVEAQIPITPTAISASSTAQLTWGRGLVQVSFTAIVGDEFHMAPLPLVDLIATDDVATVTDGIGANTNYGAALLVVEEWIDPA